MLRKVLFLTLLGLCYGQRTLEDADDDLSQLLQDIFGPSTTSGPSTTTISTTSKPSDPVFTRNEEISCRTAAGVNGKCVPSNLCLSGSAPENVKYKGKCVSTDLICCPEKEVGKKCGMRSNELPNSVRILSKEMTEFAEFPWLVAVLHLVPIRQDGPSVAIFASGGSLIHPRVVMTTAHNVQKLNKLRIRAGEYDTNSTDEPYTHQERDVSRVILHEGYNTKRTNLHNDIALLLLEKPVDIMPHVSTVCLPSATQPPASATKCVSAGWGKDNFGKEGAFQTIPKKVELPVIDHSDCQTDLRKTRLGPIFKLHESFLCAGGVKGLDTCTGDGGSPLMCPVPGENGRVMASAMVAWGIGCGDEYPSVYADVAFLKPWVDSKMAELGLSKNYYTI